MAPSREYPYRNVTIKEDRVIQLDRLRAEFDEHPTRPVLLGWMVDYVEEHRRDFVRYAKARQRDRE